MIEVGSNMYEICNFIWICESLAHLARIQMTPIFCWLETAVTRYPLNASGFQKRSITGWITGHSLLRGVGFYPDHQPIIDFSSQILILYGYKYVAYALSYFGLSTPTPWGGRTFSWTVSPNLSVVSFHTSALAEKTFQECRRCLSTVWWFVAGIWTTQ